MSDSRVIYIDLPETSPVRQTKPLIYVSGPMYSEGMLPANVNTAVWAAEIAYAKGWAPVIPHLDCLAQFITGRMQVTRYLDVDFALVAVVDALLVLEYDEDKLGRDGEPSGTSQEVAFARELGKPIYTLSDLPYIH